MSRKRLLANPASVKALRASRWDEAEKAFSEALAHEHGSVIGALGLQVVSEQRGRPEMVKHYAGRAAANSCSAWSSGPTCCWRISRRG